jgi:hypothetical protein
MRPRRGASARLNLSAETIAAVDGAISTRFKGNFAGLPALGAGGIEHLTGAAISTTCISLTRIAAGFATLRFIGKAFLREKLLLSGRKDKLLAAILTDDGFVLKHVVPLLS